MADRSYDRGRERDYDFDYPYYPPTDPRANWEGFNEDYPAGRYRDRSSMGDLSFQRSGSRFYDYGDERFGTRGRVGRRSFRSRQGSEDYDLDDIRSGSRSRPSPRYSRYDYETGDEDDYGTYNRPRRSSMRGRQGYNEEYGYGSRGWRDPRSRMGDYGYASDYTRYGTRGQRSRQYDRPRYRIRYEGEGRGDPRYAASRDYNREIGYDYGYGPDTGWDREYQAYTPTISMDRENWYIPGPYVGIGPKGFMRSDQNIAEDVNLRLMYHGQINPSEITVQVENGNVTLEGTVDNRREKRLAEDIAESIMGIKDVTNNLKIKQVDRSQQEDMRPQQAHGQTQAETQQPTKRGKQQRSAKTSS